MILTNAVLRFLSFSKKQGNTPWKRFFSWTTNALLVHLTHSMDSVNKFNTKIFYSETTILNRMMCLKYYFDLSSTRKSEPNSERISASSERISPVRYIRSERIGNNAKKTKHNSERIRSEQIPLFIPSNIFPKIRPFC